MEVYNLLMEFKETKSFRSDGHVVSLKKALFAKLYEDGLITLFPYANGDFYELTDRGHEMIQKIEKPFIVANVRKLTDMLGREEITYSKMVEMMNEAAKEWANKINNLK